jgi:hypothetical protein
MSSSPRRPAAALLALLALAGGAFALLLAGGVPLPLEGGIAQTVIAGVTAAVATALRARLPALAAATATVGFALGVVATGFLVTVGAALVVVGAVGFLVTTLHLAGARRRAANTA